MILSQNGISVSAATAAVRDELADYYGGAGV